MSEKNCFFTFVMEFRGGTYISQVTAPHLEAALISWASTLKVNEIEGMTEERQRALLQVLPEEHPVPLTELTNVWCFTPRIQNSMALVNVILTSEQAA